MAGKKIREKIRPGRGGKIITAGKRYGVAGAERYGGKRHSKHVEVIVWLPRIAASVSSAFRAATKET